MTATRLWLQKQCVLLSRDSGGSPLDWLDEPLCRLGGWMDAMNELNRKQPETPRKFNSMAAAGLLQDPRLTGSE